MLTVWKATCFEGPHTMSGREFAYWLSCYALKILRSTVLQRYWYKEFYIIPIANI